MFSSASVVVRGDEKTTLCLWYPFFVVIVREILLWCDVRHDVSVLVKEKTFLSLSHSLTRNFLLLILCVSTTSEKFFLVWWKFWWVLKLLDGWPTFDCFSLLNLLTLMRKLKTLDDSGSIFFFIVRNLGLSPWDEFALLSNCLRINK